MRPGRLVRSLATASTISVVAAALAVTPVIPAAAADGTVQGVAYLDFGDDGRRSPAAGDFGGDTAVAGIGVRAVDAAGATVGTATTGADGAYTLSVRGAVGSDLRIEFDVDEPFRPARIGSGNGGSVRFVQLGASGVDLGVTQAGAFLPAGEPYVVVPAQRAPIQRPDFATLPALYGFPYSTKGHPASGLTTLATQAQLGSAWGEASYDQRHALSAAFFRRGAPLGPGGLGAIYATDVTAAVSGTPNASVLTTIPNVGPDPRGATVPAGYDWLHDTIAFSAVGKIGLGDIEMATDREEVFAVNLTDRQLYSVPLRPGTGGAAPTAGTPEPIALPLSLPGAAKGCLDANVRPFGLGTLHGLLHVTLTCTGPLQSDLRAYVYTMDETTRAISTAPVIETALDYPRSSVGGPPGLVEDGSFQPWSDEFKLATPQAELRYASPLASTISFDAKGVAQLSILDRSAPQYEAGLAHPFRPTDNAQYYAVFSGGELLKYCGTPRTGWQVEQNARCPGSDAIGRYPDTRGPGGGVFYDNRYEGPSYGHGATMLGSALQLPGYSNVMATVIDPLYFAESGVRTMSNTSGRAERNGVVIDSTTGASGFLKAGSMGDLAAMTALAPVEIGNRVWFDRDLDGVQDPDEPPLPGVTVTVYAADGTTRLATATTDADGTYLFSSAGGDPSSASARYGVALDPETEYLIRIDTPTDYAAGGPLDGLAATRVGTGDGVLSDSNGVRDSPVSTSARVRTPAAGAADHTIDFGFGGSDLALSKELASGSGPYRLGDEVRFTLTVTNVGVAPAASPQTVSDRLPEGLEFVRADGDGWTVTDADGPEVSLTRDGAPLAPDESAPAITLVARVTAETAGTVRNVAVVEPPADAPVPESVPRGTAPDRYENGSPVPADGAPSNNDAGVDVPVLEPFFSLGNRLWVDSGPGDATNNGRVDEGEPPVAGAIVELMDENGNPVIGADGTPRTQTTDENGYYRFDGIPGGTYRVRVAAENFRAGGVLGGHLSSSGSSTEFYNETNNVDKGQDAPDPASTGVITAPILLDPGAVFDGDPDATGAGGPGPTGDAFDHLVADFGFVQTFDLTLTKAVTGNQLYQVGSEARFALVVTNNGPGVATTGFTVSDRLPAGMEFVSAEGSDWVVTDGDGPEVTLEWRGARLAAGESASAITVVARVTTETAGMLRNLGVVEPSPVQRTPESVPVGSGPDRYENGDPVPAAGSPSNNDASAVLPVSEPTFSIGNRVWSDTGEGDASNNGRFDVGEAPVAGVLVELLDASGSPVTVDGEAITRTTDENGFYRFDGFPAGTYRVRVAASNFAADGPLAGWVSSTGASASFDAGSNGVDKGEDAADPAGSGVTSGPVTVGRGVVGDGESAATGFGAHGPLGDDFDNLTVDFGFVEPYDLTLSKALTGDADAYPLGSEVRFLLTVTNNGPGTASSGLTVSDRLPEGLEFVSASGAEWTVADGEGPEVTLRWGGGELASGASASIVEVIARVSATEPGALRNVAVVEPSPAQRAPEAVPVGSSPDAYENGDPQPAPGAPSNNDASAVVPVSAPPLSLGNRLWFDTGAASATDNGRVDAGERPVAGAVIELLDENGAPVRTAEGAAVTTTTDAEGAYRFDGLVAGTYRVRVAASNFAADGPLVGTLSSRGTATTFDGGSNGSDTGEDAADPAATGVTSAPVVLRPGTIGDGADAEHGPSGDPFDNLTVDFGFVPQLSLGNRVWFDAGTRPGEAGNGVLDAGESPAAGVIVELLDDREQPVLGADGRARSVVTDPDGFYRFDALVSGGYRVRVAAANFAPGGVLDSWVSAAPTSREFASNGRDTGINDPDPATRGILSDVVLLGFTSPSDDVDAGAGGSGGNGPGGDAADVLTVDFGFVQPVAVGDRVWVDGDGDGRQGEGEPPLPGITVELLHPDGSPATDVFGAAVPPAMTDAEGRYVFDRLSPGAYRVRFSALPPGYALTTSGTGGAEDSNPDAEGVTPVFEVGPGGTQTRPVESGDRVAAARVIDPTIDAGLVPMLAVGSAVWIDANRSGTRDSGEPPVAGVRVELLTANGEPAIDVDGTPVAPVFTDANGRYVFDGLRPGQYRVRFSGFPAGAGVTSPNAGSDRAADSDADATGLTRAFVLALGTTRPAVGADGITRALAIDPTIDLGIVFPDPAEAGSGDPGRGLDRADARAPQPPAVAVASPASPLAVTGGQVAWVAAGAGAVLLLAGIAIFVLCRRRGRDDV